MFQKFDFNLRAHYSEGNQTPYEGDLMITAAQHTLSPDTPNTLPAEFYTSDERFRKDIEQIFFDSWVCCGRSEKIGEPGQFFLQEIGGESIILLRDRQGRARAFYNVCRHRGTRMCTDPAGKLPNSIQCPYHAWTYSLDGQLIGAPHMDELGGFDKSEYPLYSIATAEWEGMLYINLSAEPAPFEEDHAALMGKFAAWHLPKLRVGGRIDYDIKANWKLLVQNYSECYHCPGVHPALAKLSPYRSGDNDLMSGPFLGGSMAINHEAGSMTMSGRACARPIGDVAGEDLSKVYYYSLFPNTLLSLHPDYVMLHTLWPQSADRTLVTCEWLFEPDAMAKDGFEAEDAVAFWDMTNRQDWHMCELSQAGIGSRAYRPGPYSTLERMPVAFDQYYLSRIER